MPKIDCTAKILSNIEIAQSYFQMTLECPEIATIVKPGQFVHVLISQQFDPLLRRPFTIYKAKDGKVDILFQVIGKGTLLLSQKCLGEAVNVMGPLGNGFSIPDELQTAVLVGGGVGIATLMLLAEELRSEERRVLTLIGARSEKMLLCVDEFRKIGSDVYVSTDDGSFGYKGFVTELLKEILQNVPKHQNAIIYACGPDEMLKSVTKISADFNIPAQIAIENRMGCGVGACLGCVRRVKTQNGGYEYKRVCVEGPVFDVQEIIWEVPDFTCLLLAGLE